MLSDRTFTAAFSHSLRNALLTISGPQSVCHPSPLPHWPKVCLTDHFMLGWSFHTIMWRCSALSLYVRDPVLWKIILIIGPLSESMWSSPFGIGWPSVRTWDDDHWPLYLPHDLNSVSTSSHPVITKTIILVVSHIFLSLLCGRGHHDGIIHPSRGVTSVISNPWL